MKSLVLTEYWKVVDSQSGRQSHWVAETFLIAFKKLGVSSRLGGEICPSFNYHTYVIHPFHLQVLLGRSGLCGKYLWKKCAISISVGSKNYE